LKTTFVIFSKQLTGKKDSHRTTRHDSLLGYLLRV